jgi:hypothetical protein
MAHARRKFFELHATNKSQLAEQALRYIQLLYEIESEVRDLEPDLRRRIRQEKAVPMMDWLHAWIVAQRYLDDGAVPIDNNWQITRFGRGHWGARTGSSQGR